jgi:hypothetical protein
MAMAMAMARSIVLEWQWLFADYFSKIKDTF